VSLATTPKAREAILAQDPPDVTLVNYELLPKLDRWHWPLVVLDESTRVKNRASQAFKSLRKVSRKIERLIELTGTPLPNGLMDLWSQLYLIDGGERLGRTLTAYRERWFTQQFYGYKPRLHAQKEIEQECRDVCLVMRTEDYLDMPPITVIDVPVTLPPAAKADYKELKKTLTLDLHGESITAANAAVMTDKLIQLTAGTLYDDNKATLHLHDAKLDALDDIINGGEPVLIIYRYRAELAAMRDRYPQLVELRDAADAPEKWNRGEIQLLAIHPASAGHGLNLQHGGRIAVWTSPTFNLEHYQQANARLWRNGQTKPVTIYRLLAEGTIDHRVIDVIDGKGDVQSAILEELK
jgi:hypothetical protein